MRVTGRTLCISLLLLLIGGGAFVSAAGIRPALATPGSLWEVTAETRLQAAPGKGAQPTQGVKLVPGQRLLEFAQEGTWLRVGVMGSVGLEGWVRRGDVKPLVTVARGSGADPLPTPKPQSQPPKGDRFRLAFGGSPALLLDVDCRLVGHGGEKRVSRKRMIASRELLFRGTAVSCRIKKRDSFGRLKGRLYQNGRLVARANTSAPFNSIRLRSDGPWGFADGRRDSRGIFLNQPRIGPAFPPGTLIFSPGTIVPPMIGEIVVPIRP